MIRNQGGLGLACCVGLLALHCESPAFVEEDASAPLVQDASPADHSTGETSASGASSAGRDPDTSLAVTNEETEDGAGPASTASNSTEAVPSEHTHENTNQTFPGTANGGDFSATRPVIDAGSSSAERGVPGSSSPASSDEPATEDASAGSPSGASVSTAPTSTVPASTSLESTSFFEDTSESIAVPCDQGFWFDTATSLCLPLTSCEPDQFVKVPATATSDRICETCPDGAFSPGGQAVACCPAGVTSFNEEACCIPDEDSSELQEGGAGQAGADGGIGNDPSDGRTRERTCSASITIQHIEHCGALVVDEAGDLYATAHDAQGTRVTKFDAEGETMWQWEDPRSLTLQRGADHRLYSIEAEETRLSVARLHPEGDEEQLWTVEDLPAFTGVSIAADGAFYLVGSIPYLGGGLIGQVTRIDPDGIVDWTVELTPPTVDWVWGCCSNTHALAVGTDDEGNAYVTSQLYSRDFFPLKLELTKLARSGQLQWRKELALPEASSGFSRMLVTQRGVFVGYDYALLSFIGGLSAQHIASAWSLSFDGTALGASGLPSLQAKTVGPSNGFGANSWWGAMATGSDGTWAVIGTTDGYFDAPSAGGRDWFLGVVNPQGVGVLRQFGTSGDDSVCNVAVDDAGTVFVTGKSPEGVSTAGLPPGAPYLMRIPASYFDAPQSPVP